MQEVAYASLVEGKRAKLHRRVGEALETLNRESPEEAYGLLARHFTEGDEPEKAIEYLLAAGDRARAMYADQEAIEHYRRARDFLVRIGDDRRARDTIFKMGLAYHLAFDFDRAEEAYDEAFCCRVEEPQRLEPTETVETALGRVPYEIVGGYTTESAHLTEQLFRGLLTLDRNLNVVPSLADNFRVSNDGLTYLFRLSENARWSDGVPVTADDFVFGWTELRARRAPMAFLLEDVETATALDERTLEVRAARATQLLPVHPRLRVVVSRGRATRSAELGDDWRLPREHRPKGALSCSPSARMTTPSSRSSPHWAGQAGRSASFATRSASPRRKALGGLEVSDGSTCSRRLDRGSRSPRHAVRS